MDVKMMTETVDPGAVNQIYQIAKAPAMEGSVIRVMPDVHKGVESVVGFTAKNFTRMAPSLLGNDIGCGVMAANFGPEQWDLKQLDRIIREKIQKESIFYDHQVVNSIEKLNCYWKLEEPLDVMARSIGTLGGGNHFIELDEDEDRNFWLVIHTGSRLIGPAIAKAYQREAEDYCGTNERLPWLPDIAIDPYFEDLERVYELAYRNCYTILGTIASEMKRTYRKRIWVKHNYIDRTNPLRLILRKGAIDARKGTEVIIPLNMRDGCILGVGKGNPDWNESAPHGAGRKLSRSMAKEILTMQEFEADMKGIYTASVRKSKLSEAPRAYKEKAELLKSLSETVTVKEILKPVYNFKA